MSSGDPEGSGRKYGLLRLGNGAFYSHRLVVNIKLKFVRVCCCFLGVDFYPHRRRLCLVH